MLRCSTVCQKGHFLLYVSGGARHILTSSTSSVYGLTITFWSLMLENVNIWSSPEESNPPFPVHLSNNNHIWGGYTPTSILESGLLPPSTGLCKSAKYARKQGNKSVYYTEGSISLQIRPHLEHAASLWDPYQQGLINSLERVQKFALGVHQNLEFRIQVFASVMHLPTLASRRHYLKLCLPYQIVNGCLNFPTAPIVTRNLSTSLRNTPWKATNTHECPSVIIFPHTIGLWNSLPPSAQNCQSLHSFSFWVHY